MLNPTQIKSIIEAGEGYNAELEVRKKGITEDVLLLQMLFEVL